MILAHTVLHRGDVNERDDTERCCAGFFKGVVVMGCKRNCSSVLLVIPTLTLVERNFSVMVPSSSGLERVVEEVRFQLNMPCVDREWVVRQVRPIWLEIAHALGWRRIEEGVLAFVRTRFVVIVAFRRQ
jgi:hypothetical protein